MQVNAEKCSAPELTAQGQAGNILSGENRVAANDPQFVGPEILAKKLNEKVQKALWQDPVIKAHPTSK